MALEIGVELAGGKGVMGDVEEGSADLLLLYNACNHQNQKASAAALPPTLQPTLLLEIPYPRVHCNSQNFLNE